MMKSQEEINDMRRFIDYFNDGRFMDQQYRKGILDALEFVLYDTERLQKVKRDLWDNSKVKERSVIKQEPNNEHMDWIISQLEEWEATFEGKETRLPGIIGKLRAEAGLTAKETDDLVFHLWQKAHSGGLEVE